ncbi:MAG: hypothetical protein PGN23_16860 [Sphingomonas adhaesiva]|uniref:hypothetical protein n=1 Tax=Sphingomonas adhaesiva TaxID=28212 RepID=UPI002FF4B0DC
MTDTPRRSTRRINGLPALIAIALLIVAALFVTFTREDARLKPATGAAQAMALAAEEGLRPAPSPKS